MIDEMLQAALGLNVEEEIDKRVHMARKMVEDGRIEESGAHSSIKGYPSESMKQLSTGKKNVKF